VTGFRFRRTREFGTLIVWVAMLLACEAASRAHAGRSFIASPQFGRLFEDASFVALAAVGACAAILSGGVDLSAGSVMGLAGITMAHAFMNLGWPGPLALLAGLAAGSGVGLCNGVLVGAARIPPFIATLGFLSIARGISYWVTGGITISIDRTARPFAGAGFLADRSWAAALLAGAAGWIVLAVYAVGGNEEAARFAGLRIGLIKAGVYTAAGLCAALAGCALALHHGSAYVALGAGYELQIIAACALGGVSFSGGQGGVGGAMLGALTLQTLRILLLQLRVKSEYIDIFYGTAIVLAVGVDQLRRGDSFARWFGRKSA
jgi:ribose/xylose/arabinose/galactoside ABC-type transport system permease subunit